MMPYMAFMCEFFFFFRVLDYIDVKYILEDNCNALTK